MTHLTIRISLQLVPVILGDTTLMPNLTSLRVRFNSAGSTSELISLENRCRKLTFLDIGTQVDEIQVIYNVELFFKCVF